MDRDKSGGGGGIQSPSDMEMLRDVLQQYSEEMKQGCDWQDSGKTHTVKEESETEAGKGRAKGQSKETCVIFNQMYSSRLTQCT